METLQQQLADAFKMQAAMSAGYSRESEDILHAHSEFREEVERLRLQLDHVSFCHVLDTSLPPSLTPSVRASHPPALSHSLTRSPNRPLPFSVSLTASLQPSLLRSLVLSALPQFLLTTASFVARAPSFHSHLAGAVRVEAVCACACADEQISRGAGGVARTRA
eukprot:6188513-Pleurochrysis_carterae.AAC.3